LTDSPQDGLYHGWSAPIILKGLVMMQWEYLYSTAATWPEMGARLEKAGLEGWELITVIQNANTRQLTHTLFFKRPMKASHS
jgi:hypothetical protein